jgi:serine/threonine protein kinase
VICVRRLILMSALTWRSCCVGCHHVATGLQQLHFSEIAHQDVKPANILVTENQTAKIGDMGRAHRHAVPMNHVKQERDPTYAHQSYCTAVS